MTESQHPVTICACDGVLARGEAGEVYLNSVLATTERCWFTVHITVRAHQHDAFGDLQTWREESAAQFRPSGHGLYDLRLEIDGARVELDSGRGNGGGMDEESRRVHWTQSLRPP